MRSSPPESAEAHGHGRRPARLRGRRWEDILWTAQGDSAPIRLLKASLVPLEGLYRLAILARSFAYDHGWIPSLPGGIPTVAIGNLTVGGTGKTPFAAWAAREFRRAGWKPAIVLRGYGGDEAAVHAALNPEIPIVADPDRRRGVRTAAGAGAELAVLDDAFQHRRLRPTLNVLLLGAEEFRAERALLPRGRWREPLRAARRADLLIITRKSASVSEAEKAAAIVAREVPTVVQGRIALVVSDAREYRGGALGPSAVERLRRRGPSLALAGVAHPDSVWAGLDRLGIAAARRLALGDHYAYAASEARGLAEAAGTGGLVTTLKDAVKLGPLLPGDVSLYVLMQEVVWEVGREHWERSCGRLVRGSAGVRE